LIIDSLVVKLYYNSVYDDNRAKHFDYFLLLAWVARKARTAFKFNYSTHIH